MNRVDIFNPYSKNYFALDGFKRVKTSQKIAVIAVTLFATIATFSLATIPVFRLMVNHYIKLMKQTSNQSFQAPASSSLDKIQGVSTTANNQAQKGCRSANRTCVSLTNPPDFVELPEVAIGTEEKNENRSQVTPANESSDRTSIFDEESVTDVLQPLQTTQSTETISEIPAESNQAPKSEEKEISKQSHQPPFFQSESSNHPFINDSLTHQSFSSIGLREHESRDGEEATFRPSCQTPPPSRMSTAQNEESPLPKPGNSLIEHQNVVNLTCLSTETVFTSALAIEQQKRLEASEEKQIRMSGSVLINLDGKKQPLPLTGTIEQVVLPCGAIGYGIEGLVEKLRFKVGFRSNVKIDPTKMGELALRKLREPGFHVCIVPSASPSTQEYDLTSLDSILKAKLNKEKIPDEDDYDFADITNEEIEKFTRHNEEAKRRKVLIASIPKGAFEDMLNGIEKILPPSISQLNEKNSNLLNYLSNDIHKLNDSDFITFDTINNMIRKTEVSDDKQQGYFIFWNLLKYTYGERLVTTVYGRYFYSPDTNKQNKCLTLGDIKKALVGIAAQVKVDDLKDLCCKNASPVGTLDSYQVLNLLNKKYGNSDDEFKKDLFLKISAGDASTFDSLTDKELYYLYLLFTQIPINNDLVDIYKIAGYVKSDDPIFKQDLKALLVRDTWSKLDARFPDEAIAQQVGKNYAYFELTKGMLLPVPEYRQTENQKWGDFPIMYTVVSSLEKKGDAVIGHLLEPLSGRKRATQPVHLIFRGTQAGFDDIEGTQSLYGRDFEAWGIGRSSYAKREMEIQQMVEDYLIKTKNAAVEIRISGHSLGGVDAQRSLVSLLEKMVNGPKQEIWKKVGSLKLTTFNAPRVNETCAKQFKKLIKKIKLKNKSPLVTIEINHIRFYNFQEDFVQQFGAVLIGADMHAGDEPWLFSLCEFLKRRVTNIIVEHPSANKLSAHSYRPYNSALLGNLEWIKEDIILNEALPKQKLDEIEAYLAGRCYWDNEKHGLVEATSWKVQENFRNFLGRPTLAVLAQILYLGVNSVQAIRNVVTGRQADLDLKRNLSMLAALIESGDI